MPGEAQITAASGGGSAAFVGPPTSSIHTKLKLPGDTGSAGQVLKIKSANHSSTNAELEWAADAGGKVLQIVQSTNSDARSSTSTSFADISGTDETGSGTVWECNITPSSASNKVIIFLNARMSWSGDAGHLRLQRGSTVINAGTYTAARAGIGGGYMGGASLGEIYYGTYNMSTAFMDEPNTTSEVTYKCQWYVNSGYAVLNGPSSHLVAGYNNVYANAVESSILLMEVS
tara:strand:+ start:12857 stop:13549 length:693 start_codon:yes stop_codon:yes gene_type:complete